MYKRQVPYDPKDKLLKNPENGAIYPFPVKGGFAVFKASGFLPLINCPPVHEEYDIPQHHALFLYNTALAEGQLSGFNSLIDQLRNFKMVMIGCIIATICVMVGAVMMVKGYGDTVEAISAQFEIIKSAYGV